jgi:hypothetical protein
MARTDKPPSGQPASSEGADKSHVACDPACVAEDISAKALELALRARRAGLTTLAYHLETAALSAAADGVSANWPTGEV